jgi:hypothetical protein
MILIISRDDILQTTYPNDDVLIIMMPQVTNTVILLCIEENSLECFLLCIEENSLECFLLCTEENSLECFLLCIEENSLECFLFCTEENSLECFQSNSFSGDFCVLFYRPFYYLSPPPHPDCPFGIFKLFLTNLNSDIMYVCRVRRL